MIHGLYSIAVRSGIFDHDYSFLGDCACCIELLCYISNRAINVHIFKRFCKLLGILLAEKHRVYDRYYSW